MRCARANGAAMRTSVATTAAIVRYFLFMGGSPFVRNPYDRSAGNVEAYNRRAPHAHPRHSRGGDGGGFGARPGAALPATGQAILRHVPLPPPDVPPRHA